MKKINPIKSPFGSNRGNALFVLGIVLLIILLIVVGPLITIWALNTLFPALAIESTFATWFATLWIAGIFSGHVSRSKSN